MVPASLHISSSGSTSGSSGQTCVESLYTSSNPSRVEDKVIALTTNIPYSDPVPFLHSSSSNSICSGCESLIGSSRSSWWGVRLANRSHPFAHYDAPTCDAPTCDAPTRDAPTQVELHFAMKAIQRNHQSDITLDDVIKASNHRKLLQLGWEIEEAKLNKLVLIAFEEKKKKHLQMADSDHHLFKKLLVDQDIPALEQDVECLVESHDSEPEDLATADEQLFQMSSISSLATKYVSHRFPQNSSDTKGFRPGLNSDLYPSGQPVITQLKLLGNRATTPDQYQVQMNPSLQQQPQQYQLPAPQQYHHQPQDPQQYEPLAQPHFQALQQYELPPQPQYQVPQQYELPLQQHQLQYQAPQQYVPPPQHQQHQHHKWNMGTVQAQAYAGAFALLWGEGSRLPSQPDLGKNVCGEQTQGIIRCTKHVSDSGRQRQKMNLPPTPTIPMAATPNAPAESTTDSAPISMCITLSTKEMVDGTVVEWLLENEVLINMVIGVLIGGWLDVLEGPMDQVFASCGATIYCMMYAHRTGRFIDVSVNSSTFDDAYQDIIAIIQTIRASDVLIARFNGVQQEITIRVANH
ncbi:hypothetical protein F4604DRAFT_1954922 [Suillus subluteus]|nr:hypothetical protein F4604DRAFT_1954922 [Suillus subluteus]